MTFPYLCRADSELIPLCHLYPRYYVKPVILPECPIFRYHLCEGMIMYLSLILILTIQLDRVRNFSIVLKDVEVVLPQQGLSSQEITELHDIVEGCGNVLKKLNDTLEKYQELDSRSLSGKARRVWKRLKLEPDDIRDLRSRLSSNVTLLIAFQNKFTG